MGDKGKKFEGGRSKGTVGIAKRGSDLVNDCPADLCSSLDPFESESTDGSFVEPENDGSVEFSSIE